MGNRYTRSSLTQRQRDTILKCIDKIIKINNDRISILEKSDNESSEVIDFLSEAVDNLLTAVKTAREWID